MTPILSIIIPCHNCVQTIDETIQSILIQNYPNIEIILVNDGSTDATEKHIREVYGHNQVIKYFEQKNSGVSAARNNGVKFSSGDYITFLDSDDLFAENKLRLQFDFLLKNHFDIVFGDLLRFEDVGNERNFFTRTSPAKTEGESYKLAVAELDLFSYANFSTGIFKRSVFDTLSWNEKRKTGEDWELWNKISNVNYKVGNFKEVTNFYRKHQANTTKSYFEIMTLESHVAIIKDLNVSQVVKNRLIVGKLDYYSNILRNRKDRSMSQVINFLMVCIKMPHLLSVRFLKNIIRSFSVK